MLAKNELRISITAACNMKCEYCHNEGNTKMATLSVEQVEKIVDNCYGLGLKKVRLTGGEPLVSHEVEQICKVLTEKYNIFVEMNTNGIEIEKLLYLVEKKWVKKVIIGIDYFDKNVSKRSPVGKSSEIIKNNILTLKKTGCELRIATVYDGDNQNTENMIRWAVQNNIGIRVIEIVSKQSDYNYSQKYEEFQASIPLLIDLDWSFDSLNELIGMQNGKVMVRFYHSLCRLGMCDICMKIPFRITSNGIARPCILSTQYDVNLFSGNLHTNIEEAMLTKVDFDMVQDN